MSSAKRIVSFGTPVESQAAAPGADRIVAGEPRQRIWNHYSDTTSQFFAGIWTSTRGTWRVRYTEHELCHLLVGRVAIVSAEGERLEFAAGDTFVVPAGFNGTWEVVEDCRKLYAIFEPKEMQP